MRVLWQVHAERALPGVWQFYDAAKAAKVLSGR